MKGEPPYGGGKNNLTLRYDVPYSFIWANLDTFHEAETESCAQREYMREKENAKA